MEAWQTLYNSSIYYEPSAYYSLRHEITPSFGSLHRCRKEHTDDCYQFALLPFQKAFTVDTTSLVSCVVESMIDSTVPEIVNTKIEDSPRINAKEPVVILLGWYPSSSCTEARFLTQHCSRIQYNSKERFDRHLSSSVECPFWYVNESDSKVPTLTYSQLQEIIDPKCCATQDSLLLEAADGTKGCRA